MPTKVGDFWSQTLNCRLFAPSLSFSCLSNSRMLAQCQECRVSGATGATAYTLTHLEWNKNSRSSYKKKGFYTSNNSRLLLPNTTQTTNRIRRRPGPRWKDPEYQRRRTTNPTKKERIPSPRTILQQLLRQEKRRTLPQYSGLSRQLGSTRDSTTLRNGHAKNEILRARMNSSDLEWGNKVNMWILPVLLLGQ